MTTAKAGWATNLLHFWFHDLEASDWWTGSPKVDRYFRRHFERWLLALQNRQPGDFLKSPQHALAAILLFDQVPRNLYSGSGGAFAFDPLARQLTYGLLAKGWDRQLSAQERQFAVMPLMHSEHIADQRRSLAYYAKLGRHYGLPFARSHYAMIARFGRYPHRNEALGRTSTPAELRAIAAGFAW